MHVYIHVEWATYCKHDRRHPPLADQAGGGLGQDFQENQKKKEKPEMHV